MSKIEYILHANRPGGWGHIMRGWCVCVCMRVFFVVYHIFVVLSFESCYRGWIGWLIGDLSVWKSGLHWRKRHLRNLIFRMELIDAVFSFKVSRLFVWIKRINRQIFSNLLYIFSAFFYRMMVQQYSVCESQHVKHTQLENLKKITKK